MSSGALLHLELRMPTEWARVELIREAVVRCTDAAYGQRGLGSTVGVVAAELLENAVKFGAPGQPVELEVRGDDGRVVLVATNPIAAGSGHPAALRHRLEWLRGFASPLAAMTAAFEQVRAGHEGGLGLIRIAYEGGGDLTCDTPPGRVAVRAVIRVAGFTDLPLARGRAAEGAS